MTHICAIIVINTHISANYHFLIFFLQAQIQNHQISCAAISDSSRSHHARTECHRDRFAALCRPCLSFSRPISTLHCAARRVGLSDHNSHDIAISSALEFTAKIHLISARAGVL